MAGFVGNAWSRLCMFALLLLGSAAAAQSILQPKQELYQYSLISSLMAGVYDGDVKIALLKTKGDLGIGTFSGLDGEMVAVDGAFYQIKADGKAYAVEDAQSSPLATVAFFTPDAEQELAQGFSYKDLGSLEGSLPSKNLFYAIRIDGTFSQLKSRSIGKQEKPYQPLTNVAKAQSVFDLKNSEGSIVGFWFPAYAAGVGVPGFHLHYITKDRTAGGHVLDFTVSNAVMKRATLHGMRLVLPDSGDFLVKDVSKIPMMDINQVEKSR